MLSLKIGKRTKSLRDWCYIFNASYSTAWHKYSQGEYDPAIIFSGRKNKPEDIQAKIDKMLKRTEKKAVQEEPLEAEWVGLMDDDTAPPLPIVPTQIDMFTAPHGVLLTDVLGEALMAALRRECRYHKGMPLAKAVHEAVTDWIESAQIKREVDRTQVSELAKAENMWSAW